MKRDNYRLMTLVSAGQHSVSRRPKRALLDAKAVEMAMGVPDSSLSVVHGGDPYNPALRDYLGMGIGRLYVISQYEQADVLPALMDHIESQEVDIILMGARSEVGESSGMSGYMLAEELGWSIVPNVAEIISVRAGTAEVLQGLPGGQRSRLKVSLPFIALIGNAAAIPRQVAFSLARDGVIEVLDAVSTLDEALESWDILNAKKRPKRLKIVKAKTAMERLKAATVTSDAKGGKVLTNVTPEAAAREILTLLKQEGVLKK